MSYPSKSKLKSQQQVPCQGDSKMCRRFLWGNQQQVPCRGGVWTLGCWIPPWNLGYMQSTLGRRALGQRSRQLLRHEVTSEVSSGSLLIWFAPFDFRQWVCAMSCINCICRMATVRSITLARASTLTCSLLRQLFAAWRVLLSWALISPSSGTVCCIRLHTSSRCCWVSCSFSAYARSERRSRVSFLPVGVGACDRFGIALLAVPLWSGKPKKVNWEETATGPWLDVLWHHPTLHCAMN